ncbi:MAG: hypothetical protein KJO50_04355 [Bacteroidia bacterium]|nr:hypothetical protein [Bacteroidia bacterium]
MFLHSDATSQSLNVEVLNKMKTEINAGMVKIRNISALITNPEASKPDAFLDDTWSAGTVYTKDNELISTMLRFNIQKKRMEVKVYNETRSLNVNRINGVVLNQRLFVPLKSGEDFDGTSPIYFEVLVNGELSLLNKFTLNLKKRGGSSLHPNLGTSDSFKIYKDLYYCVEKGNPMRLEKGKKKLLPKFGAMENEIESFADQNDFGFKKDKDIIVLFKQFNKLLPDQDNGVE